MNEPTGLPDATPDPPVSPSNLEQPGDYAAFRQRLQARLDSVGTEPLFTTSATDLFAAYLAALPAADRLIHTCSACRRFIDRYAGLVTINPDGKARSVFWAGEEPVPAYYAPVVAALAQRVAVATVNGVFLSSEVVWGRPVTGVWKHVAAEPKQLFADPLHSAEQAMAAKREDQRVLTEALEVFQPAHVAQACRLLESEALYRAEKVAGPIRWLRDLMTVIKATRYRRDQANLVWRAVATAPPGFAKPRGTMAGTLLEDLANGLDFPEVSRRFASKMHPLQYQRPQAAPTAGNIARAEIIIEKLGLAPALRRRYATLADVQCWTWQPIPSAEPASRSGVFAHLQPKAEVTPSPLEGGTLTMTWEKFARTVLPKATALELQAPAMGNYSALLTAADPLAPPLFQWDSLDRRNPVSSYVWIGGASAASFHLKAMAWVRVVGITSLPAAWHHPEGFTHFGQSMIVLLAEAHDTRQEGAAIFPEYLKKELHEIRATIEAHSRSAVIEAALPESPQAAGLAISQGETLAVRFRGIIAGVQQEFLIDRWD